METEKRVIIENIGENFRVIGAVYDKNKELIHAQDIVESESVLVALNEFYVLNPDWIDVELKDNTK